MRGMWRVIGISRTGALAAAIGLAPPTQAIAAGYSFTTITDPAATGATNPSGINDAGQIVGYYYDATGPHGFIDQNGSFRTIDDPAATAGTLVFGINNQGDVVGCYNDSNGTCHGFVYSRNVFANVVVSGVSSDTSVRGINDSGQSVGNTYTNGYNGFLDSNNAFTVIADPAANTTLGTTPEGINDSGVVVGYYNEIAAGKFVYRGFVETNGRFSDLDAPAASGFTAAYGINAAGQIVGYYSDGTSYHGFLDTNGSFTIINAPSATGTDALGINSAGQIVGAYTDAIGSHGFVATPLTSPPVINPPPAPVATPVPEPASLVVLLTSLVGLAVATLRGKHPVPSRRTARHGGGSTTSAAHGRARLQG